MRTVALLIVLTCASASQALAQTAPTASAATDSQAPYRNPATARVLGALIPGAGHIYAGEYASGIRYYYGSACAISGGALIFFVGGMAAEAHETGWPLQVSGVVLAGLGMREWVRSALDAPRAAARANAKHRKATAKLSLILREGAAGQRSGNVGVAIAW